MHLNGLSVVRDNAEAFKLYSLAAEQGSAEGEVRGAALQLDKQVPRRSKLARPNWSNSVVHRWTLDYSHLDAL